MSFCCSGSQECCIGEDDPTGLDVLIRSRPDRNSAVDLAAIVSSHRQDSIPAAEFPQGRQPGQICYMPEPHNMSRHARLRHAMAILRLGKQWCINIIIIFVIT